VPQGSGLWLFAGLEWWFVVVGAQEDPEAVEVDAELGEVVAGVADEAGQGRCEVGVPREPRAQETEYLGELDELMWRDAPMS
jgi:hypothetical protein